MNLTFVTLDKVSLHGTNYISESSIENESITSNKILCNLISTLDSVHYGGIVFRSWIQVKDVINVSIRKHTDHRLKLIGFLLKRRGPLLCSDVDTYPDLDVDCILDCYF